MEQQSKLRGERKTANGPWEERGGSRNSVFRPLSCGATQREREIKPHVRRDKKMWRGGAVLGCLAFFTISYATASSALPMGENKPDSFNSATYDAIASKAMPAAGAPVNIKANLFLGWTGAWDTVLIKQMNLWQKWLPKGSTVAWTRNLQGPPVITDLLANKQNVAYLGDSPAIVSTTKQAIAPLKIVAFNWISPARMCGNLLVRSDAPAFKNPADAYKWLQGKTVAVPKGSCSDRIGQEMFKKAGVSVNWVYNQAEVIVTSLQGKKIDAAVVYEPNASKAVIDGYARYALAGSADDLLDADAIIMRQDFIDKDRQAAIAWLKANIQALYFMHDHPVKTIDAIKQELPGFTKENLWEAVYGQLPANTGAKGSVNKAVMTITPQSVYLANNVYDFLKKNKVVQGEKLQSDAIDSSLINQAFKELGLDPGKALFELKARSTSENPFKGDTLKKP